MRKPLDPGSMIGASWTLKDLLGSGATSFVYRAVRRNGSEAALKIMHADLALDPVVAASFVKQGYLANQVRHSSVVGVFDDGVTPDGVPYLAMEVVHGTTLEHLLESGRVFTAEEAVRIAVDLLRALEALHAADLAHRNLNPREVLLTPGGEIKIIDFDSAKGKEPFTLAAASLPPPSLRPSYMPPDFARGVRLAGASADLWAVGAILFRMITGRAVNTGASESEKVLTAMLIPPPPVRDLAPDAPRWLVEIIDRALAPEPGERWADARSMRVALETRQAEHVERLRIKAPPIPPTASHDPHGLELGEAWEGAWESAWDRALRPAPRAPCPPPPRPEALVPPSWVPPTVESARPARRGSPRLYAALALIVAVAALGGLLWYLRTGRPRGGTSGPTLHVFLLELPA